MRRRVEVLYRPIAIVSMRKALTPVMVAVSTRILGATAGGGAFTPSAVALPSDAAMDTSWIWSEEKRGNRGRGQADGVRRPGLDRVSLLYLFSYLLSWLLRLNQESPGHDMDLLSGLHDVHGGGGCSWLSKARKGSSTKTRQ